MEVKAGYKQTEVGIIPDEWNAVALRDCSSKITDGTHDTPKPVRSGVPFLTAIHVRDNWIDFDGCLYVTEDVHKVIYARCNPERNDVLLVNIGAGVATTALVNVDYEFSLKNVALIKPNAKKSFGAYINYAIALRKSEIIQDLSSGGAQPFLSLAQIGDITIPLPSTFAEQEAIAEALSDADALIEALEQLLAKKHQVKQGAMQELLTGKKRVVESGKWEVKRLGDVIKDIGDGATPSTSNPLNFGGSINWAVIDDIKDEITTTRSTLTERGLHSCPAKLWQPGTLIVSTGATIGEVGIARIPLATKQGICGIVVDAAKADTVFLKYWFVCNKQKFLAKAQGSTIKEVRAPTLVQFEISLPPLPEQTAIAEILSDMDAEITALEAKLSKAREVKAGMMSVLLTGKIRLNHD